MLEPFQPPDDVVHHLYRGDEGCPARGRAHVHRHLPAELGDDHGRILLHLERLEVVGHGEEVEVRGQLVFGVSPVAVGERTELPALDELFQLRLHVLEGLLLRLRLEGGDDVDIVEGVQLVKP